MTVLIDIETRSRADLPAVGAYRYGCDESTIVLMMAVTTETIGDPVHLWVDPRFDGVGGVRSDPKALELLNSATKVVAHNAPFELAVLGGTNWQPFIPLDKWECTAAMARIAGVAESLEKCAEMLQLKEGKDPKGKALIRRFSIPKEDGSFNDPKDFPDEWREFCEYCRRDVEVERMIWINLTYFRVKGINKDTWNFTLRMNELGIPVNVSALRNAQRILDQVQETSGQEFRQLTGLNITQREAVRRWLNANGVGLDDMQGETLMSIPTDILEPKVARAIELYRQMSFAAAKKVKTMLDWSMPDGRMRGVFKFYGTGTGRWSAGGPQMQNAKKPTPAMRPLVKPAYQAICDGASAEEIDAVYGNPVEVISSCIRQFVHDPSGNMLDADYNAIEARIAVWLSNDKQAMQEYRDGVDRYRAMAALIFNKPAASVTSDERDLGKQAILGLSYGMGAEKFRQSCEMKGMKVSAELAERAKNAFRSKHSRMVALWSKLDQSMRNVIYGGQYFYTVSDNPHIMVRRTMALNHPDGEPFNYVGVKLPSDRELWYRDPMMENLKPGEFQPSITYLGQIPMSTQWGRIKIYGAKLFENICQAVAADLMSHGAREAEAKWMLPFALIHDQALAMQMDGQTSDQFAAALTQLPPWAAGLPLKAEAKSVPYYSK